MIFRIVSRFVIALTVFTHLNNQALNAISPQKVSSDSLNESNDIDHLVDDLLERFNVPGVAIGVMVNDKIILSRGYGYRDLERKLPVTQQTLFPIGSCTKAFTALVMGQLIDDGKISWDDPVKNFIPEFCLSDSDAIKNMTIRDLLAHRTGLMRHDSIWTYLHISRYDVIPLLKHFDQAYSFRREFEYNNFMYVLAGIIIEKVSGLPWEQIVRDRIFVPIRMETSNTSLRQLQELEDFSLPYSEIEGSIQPLTFNNLYAVNPAGGINSNIVDLMKWVRLQLSKDTVIIASKTLEEMHTLQIPFLISPNENKVCYQTGYGLGWFLGHYRGHEMIVHSGMIDGFSSEICLLPHHNIGVAILTNSSSDGRYIIPLIRNHIFDNLLGEKSIDKREKQQEKRNTAKNSILDNLQKFENLKQQKPPQPFQDYVGHYIHPAYGVIEIILNNNQLFYRYGTTTSNLHYQSANVFLGQFRKLLVYGENPIIEFCFFRNTDGTIESLHIALDRFHKDKSSVFIKKH